MTKNEEKFAQAVAHQGAGRLQEAGQICRAILRGEPRHADALHLLGMVVYQMGRSDLAIEHLRKALRVKPSYVEAHNNLSNILAQHGKFDEAIAGYRTIIRLRPGSAEAHNNLGKVLRQMGKLTEAASACREALRLKPGYAEAQQNLADAMMDLGKPEEAVPCYREAIRLRPEFAEAHDALGAALLQLGNYQEGWPEYEWRWRCNGYPTPPLNSPKPIWDGAALGGRTIYLYAEQGLGDTVQFVRYARLAKALGGRVIVGCQPPLVRLLQGCAGIDLVVANDAPPPDFDVQASLLSVPRILGTTLATIPAAVPYLAADPALVQQWGRELRTNAGFKIGIAWQGSPTYAADRRRSVPLKQFTRLAGFNGVQFYSLQKHHGVEQMAPPADRLPIIDLRHRLDVATGPFMDTAAVLKNLDLVITVDTVIAHLAGALGVPVWIALSVAPHWPWLLHREDSPWYPTARLFRQKEPGNWDDVFERIAAELAKKLGQQMPLHGQDLKSPVQVITKAPAAPNPPRSSAPERPAPETGAIEPARLNWDVPASAEKHLNAALALHRQGRVHEAIAGYRQALACYRDYAEAHNNLGVAYQALGDLTEAVACYREASRIKPEYAEAHNNLGVVYQAQGRHDDALACYQEAARLNPDSINTIRNLGGVFQAQDRLEEALDCYRGMLRKWPESADIHNDIGATLYELGRVEEAIASFRESLRLKPDYAEAQNNLGSVLFKQGRVEESIPYYEQAVRFQPVITDVAANRGPAASSARVQNNLGGAYHKLVRVKEAAASFREAMRLNPDLPDAANNLGLVLCQQGMADQGRVYYDQAIRRQSDFADAHLNRALSWLQGGEFERGWPEYEWRWLCKGRSIKPLPTSKPAWDGSPLDGRTIFAYAEQGLGDTLQFVRYVSLLRQRGGRVIVGCQESLTRLLQSYVGIERLVPTGTLVPPFDVHAPLLSLPRIFGTTLATIPADVPYLSAEPERIETWRRKLSVYRGLKVGIAWQGNPQHEADRLRSIPWTDLRPLAEVEGVQLFSLQKNLDPDETRKAAEGLRAVDLASDLHDLVDTAAVMKNLDLVITVDTAVAHLAGALGVPVWVALPLSPDWRWLLQREDSPWYPTMRLFRQTEFHKWGEVLQRIKAELRMKVGHPGRARAEEHLKQGIAHYEQGRQAEAQACYHNALACDPDFVEGLNNLGTLYARQGKPEEALPHFERAARLRPSDADLLMSPARAGLFAQIHSNLGACFHLVGRIKDAVASFHEAVRLSPAYHEAHTNLGLVLYELGDLDEVRQCYERALRVAPDYAHARFNRSLLFLKAGDFERGWVEYEWRWHRDTFATPQLRCPQPIWDGSPLQGRTLLVRAEQGQGDAIQFIRYVALAKERVGRVIVEAPAPLVRLLRTCPGLDHVFARGEPLPAFDAHVLLMSLPRIFGTTLATIPPNVPYLHPEPALVERWRNELGAVRGFKVGIVWQGNPKHQSDRWRSAPLAQFARLAEVEGVRLFSLQKSPGQEQLSSLPEHIKITDLAGKLDDFVDTAALLKNLDLLITVDTAVAHLAGALGVPVWVALAFSSDWRWLTDREDSPWYPTMRLFTQKEFGNWNDVFDRISAELVKMAGRSVAPMATSAQAEAHFQQGLALHEQGAVQDAVRCYRQALACRGDYAEAHNNLGAALLQLGDFEAGWREYEWRWRSDSFAPQMLQTSQPRWDGSPVKDRTIFIYTEQGLGDALQFVRFMPQVKERCGRLIVGCHVPLAGLFETCAGIDKVAPNGTPVPRFDVHAPLMSVPHLLGTTLATIPRTIPYLAADPKLVREWGRELAATPGFKVGIAWKGAPTYRFDHHRSIPLEKFTALARVKGVQFYSLQKQHGLDQLPAACARMPLVDLGDRLDGAAGPFMDTAAIVKNLDLVITADTALAHLAGALGLPVWVALTVPSHWVWLLDREDSPWYPTMRLFRQKELGNWDDVFDRITVELAKTVERSVPPVAESAKAGAHFDEGLALHRQGKVQEAMRCYQQALACRGDYAEAHNNLGVAYQDQGDLGDAGVCYEEAVRLKPDFVDAHKNLGSVRQMQGKLDAAVTAFRAALRLKPDYAEVHNNLGAVLHEQGKLAEAQHSFERALALRPDFADACSNLGAVLHQQGKPREALRCFEEALRLKPDFADAHFNRALVYLQAGDYERGWREYEWRRRKDNFPLRPLRGSAPEWDGSPLNGRTLLLRIEQGLGDAIHFIRYAPLLQARGARVFVECKGTLAPLFKSCPGVERIVVRGLPLPAFDVQVLSMSVPTLLGTTVATIPANVPYLFADPALIEHWRNELRAVPGFKVGIVWQGNAKHQQDHFRSIPLAHFIPLARLAGVRLISLQKGHGVEQLRAADERGVIVNLGDRLDEKSGPFMDTAAVMKNLDLVIACDTASAHLAGALGVPVWVPLIMGADWRWLLEREDSPWYPTMRLFRQTKFAHWDDVFERIATELERKVRER